MRTGDLAAAGVLPETLRYYERRGLPAMRSAVAAGRDDLAACAAEPDCPALSA